jgi:hypothetical protein
VGTAEAAFNSINKTINGIINHSKFLIADWFFMGEMAEERASLDTGTDGSM